MKSNAIKIVTRLRDHGFEAYMVGGCVRDMIMGRRPRDYDVATSAGPEDVMRLFRKTIPVGKQFGVVIVRLGGKNYEVAAFREEWGYSDGRRPDKIVFATAEEDARRRDFTINGLFYDPRDDKVIDFVDGQRDIERGVVRAIGDPEARFKEDKLRLLRAVRFAARFNFQIEEQTGVAIRRHAGEVALVSAERVRDELIYILADERPADGIRLLDKFGLLEVVLPEVAAMKGVMQPPEFHPEGDVFTHTMLMLEKMKRSYARRPGFPLALLLHDVGKPPTFEVKDRIRFNNHPLKGAKMSANILRRLRLPNDTIKTVVEIVKNHLKFIDVGKMRPSTLKRFMRSDDFDLHLELNRIDCLASHGDLGAYRFCRKKLKEMEKDDESLRPPSLISGDDLIALGLSPGPIFKTILTAVEDAQLEGTVKTREEALAWAEKHIQNIE